MPSLETLLVTLALAADPQVQALTTPRDAYPDFSTDDTSLIYQTNLDGRWHIWSIDVESGRRQQLTHGDHDNYTPVVSPDGRHIAFASDRTGDRDIFVMSVTGDQVRNISNHPGLDMHPEWTADGRIVFNSSRIHGPGLKSLTTQLYVQGDPGNAGDGIYSRLARPEAVTADFVPDPDEPDALLALWDIVVTRV